MIKGSIVLVTGGTGSLGWSLTKELLNLQPEAIRIFSRNEYWQWKMAREFEGEKRLRFLIGDIRDADRLHMALKDVNYVVHCAALKHVDICEYNPIEAVKTNIDGAINIIQESLNNNVSNVLAISTDKAVHPINIYGASKLTAEKLFIDANKSSKSTAFSVVRCGNFWGSRGSVMEQWQNNNGVIKVTDPNMTRYVLPIESGIRLVIQFLEEMKGGEIFIPKMAKVTLNDIADIVAPDAEREVIGLRPGEKVNEELWTDEEADKLTDKGEYFICQS